jgi:hypothetical protein
VSQRKSSRKAWTGRRRKTDSVVYQVAEASCTADQHSAAFTHELVPLDDLDALLSRLNGGKDCEEAFSSIVCRTVSTSQASQERSILNRDQATYPWCGCCGYQRSCYASLILYCTGLRLALIFHIVRYVHGSLLQGPLPVQSSTGSAATCARQWYDHPYLWLLSSLHHLVTRSPVRVDF